MPQIPSGTVTEGPSRETYSQERGWQLTRTFKGDQAGIIAQRDLMIAQGYNTDVREGPNWELEATAAGTIAGGSGGQSDLPVDTWELQGNEVEKELLNSNVAAVVNLNPDDLAVLRDLFEGKRDATAAKDNPDLFVDNGGDPWGLLNLWLAGVKSIIVSQPTLRRTRTVSRTYQISASITGVGQVYSTARVIANESIPPLTAGSMQASTAVSKNAANSDTVDLYYGWMKMHPQITLAAYGKSQIVQEWRWGLWSELMYTKNV